MKILDLCCGGFPWIARNLAAKMEGVETKLSESFVALPEGDSYLGVDVEEFLLRRARVLAQAFKALHPETYRGRFDFRCGDVRTVKLPEEPFDVVVLDNFVNTPNEPYDCGTHRLFPGVSDELKREIILRAISLVRPEGRLIVTLYETASCAKSTLDWLVGERAVALIEKHGSVEQSWGLGERCLAELVFEKTNDFRAVRSVPLTEVQEQRLQTLTLKDYVQAWPGLRF